MVRSNTSEVISAVTENCQSELANSVTVCPRVVSLKQKGTNRVHVRIYNMTAKVVHIKPRATLCELTQAKVMHHIVPDERSDSVPDKSDSPETVLNERGVKLDDNLPDDVQSRLTELLVKWKSVFSTGPTDLGYTTLVEHEIRLTDETPFKEPV